MTKHAIFIKLTVYHLQVHANITVLVHATLTSTFAQKKQRTQYSNDPIKTLRFKTHLTHALS